MLPTVAALNMVNVGFCNTEALRQCYLSNPLAPKFANLYNLILSKPRLWAVLALQYRNWAKPFLEHGVMGVVLFGSQKQMLRVDAGWIIALVKHTHSFWDCPDVQNPRSPVCQNQATARLGKHTIPELVPSGSPFPTAGRYLLELFIEALNFSSLKVSASKALLAAKSSAFAYAGSVRKKYLSACSTGKRYCKWRGHREPPEFAVFCGLPLQRRPFSV
jgi:hypothetical protein